MDCVPICDTGDFPARDSLDDISNFPEGDVNSGYNGPSG